MSAGRSRGGPCFRRDDRRHTSASSRHVSPELCPFVCPRKSRGRRECRGVRCPRGLVRKKVESDAHEHTGSAETLRHSLRDGLTAYAKLAPATNSVLVTVADGLTAGSYRLVRLRLRRLDISHGCQAHLVLPYATRLLRPRAQSGIAPVVRTLCPLTGKPALRPPHAPNAAASTATCSNDRDDGRRPSWRNRMAHLTVDLGQARSGMFFRAGLDGWNRVDLVEEIRLGAQSDCT